MIDLHSHILPNMDDGSKSTEESIQMLQMAAEQGITHIAATPHFYADKESPENFLKRREESYNRLLQAISKDSHLPTIHLGAEVRYYEGFSQTKELYDLRIEGMDLLLLEMPFTRWNDRMIQELSHAQQYLGIPIVLAHIERYLNFQPTFGFWKKIEDTDVLIQSNANFFIQKNSRRKALSLLKKGRIHLLGSDCHNCFVRPPNLGKAVSILEDYYDSAIREWLEVQETKLIKGQ